MKRSLLPLIVLVAAAGCSSVDVRHDFDESADFSAYQSFGWISERPLIKAATAPVSPLFEGRVMAAIRSDLEAKGYRYEADPSSADVVVSFTLGTRDMLKVNSYPASYRGGWTWGGPYHQEVDVRNYLEGTLAIDLFDVAKRQPVWHGYAVRTISNRDRSNPTAAINEVVTSIMEGFPP